VKDSLERKRADVVEMYQPMTESMKEIHGGLVQCMSMTLAELKRSNTTVGFSLSLSFPSIYIFLARSR
jgi:DNA excision repair protein ERCC-4